MEKITSFKALSHKSASNWIEWICHTNFSFLTGASHPEDYIKQALDYGYHGIGITDFNGFYGIVRAYRELKRQRVDDFRIFYGSEINLLHDHHLPIIYQETLILYALNFSGYRTICQIIEKTHRYSKQEAYIHFEELAEFDLTNIIAIQPMRGFIRNHKIEDVESRYKAYKDLFQKNFYLAITRTNSPADDHYFQKTLYLQKKLDIPPLITQDCFLSSPKEKKLADCLLAIKNNSSIDKIQSHIFCNAERSMKPIKELYIYYRNQNILDEAIQNSLLLASRFDFDLNQIKYQYPQEMIPSGFSSHEYLEYLIWRTCYERYPKPADKLINTLKHEIHLVRELNFSDYFLTVWDIVSWARKNNILCQGRGSAANSAICFVLGITSVNPNQFELLFERFVSLERGDPPDIDVDFEHQRREEVIQYIYRRYSRQRAAMVANVITFRTKGAIRAIGGALGIENEAISFACKTFKMRHIDIDSCFQKVALEFPGINNIEIWKDLSCKLIGFPRHLGIHSGGFIINQHSLDHVAPCEPATMPGRSVIQWSKEDIEYLNLFKIDILALGMLSMVRRCFELIKLHYGINLSLNKIPHNDLATYQMIAKADTIGTFQIESRAQMNMLPQLKPANLYDLAIQIGIIRPGPIQGGLIHPYLRRRQGLESVSYAHPKLKDTLSRTLGVPIFQEQIMRVAMLVGNFSPGEADQLRKQIGSWTLNKDISGLVEKLILGMRQHKIAEEQIKQIVSYLKGFAEYGFPESHAISFALIAYVSSYLKCHYKEVFYTSLLNSQPMGFYSIHALIQAAKREAIKVLPISILDSQWESMIEKKTDDNLAIRLGFHLITGLHKETAEKICFERHDLKYGNWYDFQKSTRLTKEELTLLAGANVFSDWEKDRKCALWIASAANFSPLIEDELSYDFEAEEEFESIQSDFKSFKTSLEQHPSTVIKHRYWNYPVDINKVLTQRSLGHTSNHSYIHIFGLILVRQAPPTAKGMIFLTIEDESGLINLAIPPNKVQLYEELIYHQNFICASGKLQKHEGAMSILVDKIYDEKIPQSMNVIDITDIQIRKIETIKQQNRLGNSGPYRL